MFIGPTNCNTAREQAPSSLRAIYGKEGCRNAAHGSDSIASAERELNFFFKLPSVIGFRDSENLSCVIIKPHILKENKMGAVLDFLQEKLNNIDM